MSLLCKASIFLILRESPWFCSSVGVSSHLMHCTIRFLYLTLSSLVSSTGLSDEIPIRPKMMSIWQNYFGIQTIIIILGLIHT